MVRAITRGGLSEDASVIVHQAEEVKRKLDAGELIPTGAPLSVRGAAKSLQVGEILPGPLVVTEIEPGPAWRAVVRLLAEHPGKLS